MTTDSRFLDAHVDSVAPFVAECCTMFKFRALHGVFHLHPFAQLTG